MSRANVEVALKQFDATSERDVPSLMETWTEDVTLTVHWRAGRVADEVGGRASVAAWISDWFSHFRPGYRFEIEETHDAGDRVLVIAIHHGRGRRSGAAGEQPAAHLYTLRGGRVSCIEIWADRRAPEAALEAVGLVA